MTRHLSCGVDDLTNRISYAVAEVISPVCSLTSIARAEATGFCSGIATDSSTTDSYLMTEHQKLIVKALGLSGADELTKMMYLDTSRTTLFNTVYDTLGCDFDYTRFEGVNVNVWSGSEEKVSLKTAREIKSVCPSVNVKVFENCGHGSLLTQAERLPAEINAVVRG